MMMRQTRKITVTASLELDQLERLTVLARREGISWSTIIRDAVERELRLYEQATAQAAERGIPHAANRP